MGPGLPRPPPAQRDLKGWPRPARRTRLHRTLNGIVSNPSAPPSATVPHRLAASPMGTSAAGCASPSGVGGSSNCSLEDEGRTRRGLAMDGREAARAGERGGSTVARCGGRWSARRRAGARQGESTVARCGGRWGARRWPRCGGVAPTRSGARAAQREMGAAGGASGGVMRGPRGEIRLKFVEAPAVAGCVSRRGEAVAGRI